MYGVIFRIERGQGDDGNTYANGTIDVGYRSRVQMELVFRELEEAGEYRIERGREGRDPNAKHFGALVIDFKEHSEHAFAVTKEGGRWVFALGWHNHDALTRGWELVESETVRLLAHLERLLPIHEHVAAAIVEEIRVRTTAEV